MLVAFHHHLDLTAPRNHQVALRLTALHDRRSRRVHQRLQRRGGLEQKVAAAKAGVPERNFLQQQTPPLPQLEPHVFRQLRQDLVLQHTELLVVDVVEDAVDARAQLLRQLPEVHVQRQLVHLAAEAHADDVQVGQRRDHAGDQQRVQEGTSHQDAAGEGQLRLTLRYYGVAVADREAALHHEVHGAHVNLGNQRLPPGFVLIVVVRQHYIFTRPGEALVAEGAGTRDAVVHTGGSVVDKQDDEDDTRNADDTGVRYIAPRLEGLPNRTYLLLDAKQAGNAEEHKSIGPQEGGELHAAQEKHLQDRRCGGDDVDDEVHAAEVGAADLRQRDDCALRQCVSVWQIRQKNHVDEKDAIDEKIRHEDSSPAGLQRDSFSPSSSNAEEPPRGSALSYLVFLEHGEADGNDHQCVHQQDQKQGVPERSLDTQRLP
eukprot:scaffold1307_cov200-Pinguiococcus_pyrenoidosus.AAC.77